VRWREGAQLAVPHAYGMLLQPHPDVYLITTLFFTLVFFAATQGASIVARHLMSLLTLHV
jgi:hypothetical protein